MMRFSTHLPPWDEHTVLAPEVATNLIGQTTVVSMGEGDDEIAERATIVHAKVDRGALMVTFDIPDGTLAGLIRGRL